MSMQTNCLVITEVACCEDCAVLRVSGELDQSCERLLGRRSGRLLLAGAGRRLTELLAQTGSTRLLPTYQTVGHALAELPPRERPVWPPASSGPNAQNIEPEQP
ncbi:hypothetical protein ABZ484_16985 [Streptomyces sp. NPDC006393]|uniref:hypothetical protein n=1 Tax=Streptomyces sp. NPDC006393 TaxID=3156763 RepID=UPI0033E95161